ncbi:MAG TPA: Xaa-Pro peptidase family protein [Terriglobales bacterium]|nr:Xaa-Pro peptidase family protein [Terriglobales bacterium]
MDYVSRQRELQADLADRRLDALLVTHLPNVRYLCGFTGSAGILLIGPKKALFITDGRYTEQAHAQVEGAKIVIGKGPALDEMARQIARLKLTSIGIEAEHLTVAQRTRFSKSLPKHACVPETSGLVERLRTIKDPEELESIRQAVKLGADLFDVVLKAIRPGVRESEVAAELEYAARSRGAEGMSFETIVAAGLRSALPHGVASQAIIPKRGFVVLDYGVILAGYCSDQTRTVYVGKPSAEARKWYESVLDANLAGIEAVKAGVTAGEVDKATRDVLRRARLDRYFTHSTGHGVGLEIHEMPRLGRNQREFLETGMVVTIEPGIYVAGNGGIRIEDMVAVTEHGCEVLTPVSKDLVVL